MGIWLIDVFKWVILGVSNSLWFFSREVIPEFSVLPWFGLIPLGISIVTVRGKGGSEEISEITFLFSSIT